MSHGQGSRQLSPHCFASVVRTPMVDMRHLPEIGISSFVLTPNRSLSWRGTLWLYLSLVALSSAIGIGFAIRGLWLVLPFAGLEMIALGVGLYLVARNSYRQEVIHVARHDIRIERGWTRPVQVATLPRMSSRVELVRPTRREAGRLTIHSHGKAEEVGNFLNEHEREGLASDLARALAP